MSQDETPNTPLARDRREAVREKAQKVKAKQSRYRILRRTGLGLGAVVALAGVAGVVTWAFVSNAERPQLDPTSAVDDGFNISAVAGVPGVAVMGDQTALAATPTPTPDAVSADEVADPADTEASPLPRPTSTAAPVDIRVYVDFLDERSGLFQRSNAAQLSSWVTEGAATLSYYPVAVLTPKSNGTKYSLRAANAAACVGTISPDSLFAYTHSLLTTQPAIDSDGYSDSELADLAIATGASDPKVVRTCIEEGQYTSWAKAATDRALVAIPETKIALTGTPTVLVNGAPYVGALDDPAELSQFVLTMASDAYYKTATPTPSPSALP